MPLFNYSIKATKLVLLALILVISIPVSAQRNTFSPYSRYGYGTLHDPVMGQSLGMGGTAYGLRDNSSINPMNPATYSAIDSLSFLFDFGFTGMGSSFSENGVREKNWNYQLDHIALKFPIAKNFGLSMGLYEYSQVGYVFSTSGTIPGGVGEDNVTYLNSYSATGGLNNFYIGTSYALFNRLALGVNLNYKFGNLIYLQSSTYSNSDYSSTSVSNNLILNQMNLEYGIQYDQPIGKKHRFVLGATYSAEKPFKSELVSTQIVLDTLTTTSTADFSTPQSIGVGLSYTYDDRLLVALDYAQQAWGDVPFYGKIDSLASTRRLALGLEYLPSKYGDYYYQVIKYRVGLQYSESYINFAAGNLKNIGLTFGLGLPLRNQRSVLNLAFEFGKTMAPEKRMIQENYCKMSLSVAFNETWFMKRKFN